MGRGAAATSVSGGFDSSYRFSQVFERGADWIVKLQVFQRPLASINQVPGFIDLPLPLE